MTAVIHSLTYGAVSTGRGKSRGRLSLKIERDGRLTLEVETCPHGHRDKAAAEECAKRAANRVEKAGDWLDETSPRRYVRLIRGSVA